MNTEINEYGHLINCFVVVSIYIKLLLTIFIYHILNDLLIFLVNMFSIMCFINNTNVEGITFIVLSTLAVSSKFPFRYPVVFLQSLGTFKEILFIRKQHIKHCEHILQTANFNYANTIIEDTNNFFYFNLFFDFFPKRNSTQLVMVHTSSYHKCLQKFSPYFIL